MSATTPSASTVLPSLPDPSAQAERLIELGVHEIAGLPAAELRGFAAASSGCAGALLAVHPDRAPASALAPLLRRGGKPGFVVTDMTDVDLFASLDTVALPDAPLSVLTGLDRGDGMAGWSPDEALPALTAASRTPLLLTEGILWALQPVVLGGQPAHLAGLRLRGRPAGPVPVGRPAAAGKPATPGSPPPAGVRRVPCPSRPTGSPALGGRRSP
jgi:hypothetical protein